MKNIYLLLTLLLFGCGVKADKPDMRRFPNGAQLKFIKGIQHDHAEPGKLISDYKMPMIVQSSYWSEEWNEYWYNTIDQGGSGHNVADRSVDKF